ncbi:MAG: pili assembly chaperone [Gammaproteobacteria bacterium]|nr:pili assembly chaperone [Gammaproteobacteria bacterium]
MFIHRTIFFRRSTLVCSLFVALSSNLVLASKQPVAASNVAAQVDRYSVMVVGPTAGQLDLLEVTSPVVIPNDIETIGDALGWLLRDSGYRLASESVLTSDTKKMLELPLPVVHRRFNSMSLKTAIALMVGPAFHIVQDPVHRLIAFERCETSPNHSTTGEPL